jgi:hypothetical protein
MTAQVTDLSMPRISATIVACNEANNLARALRSLACADEIVVVDSGAWELGSSTNPGRDTRRKKTLPQATPSMSGS